MIKNKLQHGEVILTIVFVLLGTISLLVLFVANAGIIGAHVIANEYQTQQAFEAAAAGMDYGVVYLQENSNSIIADSDADGTINTNSFSQTLSDGSNFTLSYTNPVANDFTLIEITVVGTSADSNASRQMKQLVKFVSFGEYFTPLPLVTKGYVEITGSALVRNLVTPTTIWSGSNIDFQGAGHTESNDGSGSSKSYTHTDVVPNYSALGGLSNDVFFTNFFGVSAETVKSSANSYFSSNDTKIYNSELEGKQGELIWIDQTGGDAKITSAVQIGSQANPVILVVNGDFKTSGSPVIYGFIYVTGNLELTGNEQINGGIIANGEAKLDGSSEVIYNATVLDNVRNSFGLFNIVPGSWKDF